jgi:dTDP-4-amino-4,6-dideoxygalactose transaminase
MTSANQFEIEFAKWMGVPSAFSFWKARVALYTALKALGIGPGDEIIMPGYTCVMNVNPIKYLGVKPIYVDIEPDTFNINPDLIETKITPRTKVILAQHTYGYPCDMDKILVIAQRHNLAVIEDCCLSLGSTYRERLVGTFGRAAYFSFQWNKPITTGLGGMLITADEILAKEIQRLRDTEMCRPSSKDTAVLAAELIVHQLFIYPRTAALAQRIFRFLAKKGYIVGSYSTTEYTPTMAPDFFKAMSSVQASWGFGRANKIDQNIAHRRKMAELYDELLPQKGFPSQTYDKSVMNPVLVRYPLRIQEKNEALKQAASAGVELGSWFECPLHQIETSFDQYDYTPGMCPEAEKASREVVNLPVHPRAGEKTVRRTVEFINRFTPAGR